MKKYELTSEFITINRTKLYRIKALKDFGDVKKGELGGFIEKEVNLAQEGDCWVYDRAIVKNKARIFDNVRIKNRAVVKDNAKISYDAQILDSAVVGDNAVVSQNAIVKQHSQIDGDTHVCGSCIIQDDAHISQKATVKGKANISGASIIGGNAVIDDYAIITDTTVIKGNAIVKGNSIIEDCAIVGGYAICIGNARISESMAVMYGICDTDLSEDIEKSIKHQCNLPVENGKVIAYKIVRADLSSIFDSKYFYKVGEIAEFLIPLRDDIKETEWTNDKTVSCAPGLHFSNLTYWDTEIYHNPTLSTDKIAYLKAEIDIKDILAVQRGKIRCAKAKILSIV